MWTFLLLLIAADTDDSLVWANRTENAAVRTREAATTLAETARGISTSGRIGALGVLSSDADELVRRVDLLVDVTREQSDGVEPPGGAPPLRRPLLETPP